MYIAKLKGNVKAGVDVEIGAKTLIVGPNGSGKSSIVNAIELALTARAGDVAGRVDVGREADVMFSQEMIPHHQQAVDMADLALDPARGASPAVQDLARRIRAAQAAEIADMRAWLGEWGAPAAGGGHMGDDHAGMGMLSEEQLQALAAAEGAAFDRLWLEGMIEHHEGALVMASHIAERGEDPRVAELSASIDETQQAEIDEMRRLLEG